MGNVEMANSVQLKSGKKFYSFVAVQSCQIYLKIEPISKSEL